jgi:hypothetical protein
VGTSNGAAATAAEGGGGVDGGDDGVIRSTAADPGSKPNVIPLDELSPDSVPM